MTSIDQNLAHLVVAARAGCISCAELHEASCKRTVLRRFPLAKH
jgi:hypothetical protein